MTKTEKIQIEKLLVKVKDLIKNKENWTQGVMARTKTGEETFPFGEQATCFCLLGAISKVSHDLGFGFHDFKSAPQVFLREFLKRKGYDSISTFNDFENHKNVIKGLNEAIKELRRA